MLSNPLLKAAFVLVTGLSSIVVTVNVANSDEKKPAKPKVLPMKNGYLLYSVGENSREDGGNTFDSKPAGDDLVVRITLAK